MTDIKLSRRAVLGVSGGAALFGGAALPGAAMAATELDKAHAMVGTRFSVTGEAGMGSVVLEEIVELPARGRVPGEVMARNPFIAVFRQDIGIGLTDGTYHFSADGLTGEPLMVSEAYSEDGTTRLEAVFN